MLGELFSYSVAIIIDTVDVIANVTQSIELIGIKSTSEWLVDCQD